MSPWRTRARTFDNAPVRPVNTEELFDVQQQSDFFLSLGQHDQAIAVLREHIAANPGTSALAYLDLLRIFHSLDRKEDYARLAEEFERAFNADVPAFEHFTETGRGLEHYRSALARIESQWPAPGDPRVDRGTDIPQAWRPRRGGVRSRRLPGTAAPLRRGERSDRSGQRTARAGHTAFVRRHLATTIWPTATAPLERRHPAAGR